MMVFGPAATHVTRMPQAAKGIERSTCWWFADPHPSPGRCSPNARTGTYLPADLHPIRNSGSRTASNRSLQWGEQIVKPIFESKDDYEVMYLLAKKLGFAEPHVQDIKVENNHPSPRTSCARSTAVAGRPAIAAVAGAAQGAHGQPGEIRSHNLARAEGPPGNRGDYYGLPWPCWGTPEYRHPGTHTLYNTNLHVKDGGGTFPRPFWRRTQRGDAARGGIFSRRASEIKDGYPEFTLGVLKKLGWDADLTQAELASIQKVGGNTPDTVSWSTDLSGGIQRVALEHGCIPFGNGKARAVAWNLPDPIPVHREAIYTSRPISWRSIRRCRMPSNSACRTSASRCRRPGRQGYRQGISADPELRTAGGVRGRRRGDPLQQVAGRTAARHVHRDQSGGRRGSRNYRRRLVWVTGPEAGSKARMKALVTERVGKGVTWCPFHFAGWFDGADQRGKYPKGNDPIVLGESVNVLTTYGFDPVTNMQEPKSPCVRSERHNEARSWLE